MNIHEGKGYHNVLPIVLFTVTIAENLQNMKPVQNCTSLIFARFTRDIWNVLSMVFYLSYQFTNPIMSGIILKSYLSSMLWHKFHEDIIMQTQKILL